MTPVELLLDLFWIAIALVVAALVILLFLKNATLAAQGLLALGALALIGLFGFLVAGDTATWIAVVKRVAWISGNRDFPGVSIGLSFSAGAALSLLVLALLPILALINGPAFSAEVKGERQLVALLPLLAASIFGSFSAGVWSSAVSGILIMMSMGIVFSSQWELVGESQAMERTIRDFLMGVLLVALSRWYLLVYPNVLMWQFVLLAVALFNRVGPFSATVTQELLAQSHSWRRLVLEWSPRMTGAALVGFVLAESQALPGAMAEFVSLVAAGVLLSLIPGLASTSSAKTSGWVLSALGIWAGLFLGLLGIAHYKVVYLWLFLSGWSVLSLQDLVRSSASERPKATAQGKVWTRIVLVMTCAVILGLPGWMSATLFLSLFQSALSDVFAHAALVFAYIFYALLSLVWMVRVWRESRSQAVLTASLAVPIVTVLIFGAIIWDGTLSGGWMEDAGMQIDQFAQPFFSSQFEMVLGAITLDARGWMLLAVILASILCAVIMRGGVDRPAALRGMFPNFYAFVDQGFGTERIADRVWTALARGGQRFTASVVDTAWVRGVYRPLHYAFSTFSIVLHRWGSRGDQASEGFFAHVFKAPSLVAQAFQGGDLRWYLFWGILVFVLMLLRQGWFVK